MIAIDPGPKCSAWLFYQSWSEPGVPFECAIEDNDSFIHRIWHFLTPGVPVVIEKIECYGMPVGAEVFETVEMIGRIKEAVRASQAEVPESERSEVVMMPRRKVKLCLCNSAKAKDANVRQALIDRFGGKEKAIGKKKAPGPLYAVKSHCWSALALAVTHAETSVNERKGRK